MSPQMAYGLQKKAVVNKTKIGYRNKNEIFDAAGNKFSLKYQ